MKIINIKQKDNNIFEVTESPNIIQRIFGFKSKITKYKDTGRTYHYFDTIPVYVNQKGQILGPVHKITDAIDNYRRSF